MDPKDTWSIIYDTPVKRLLYRCGLKATMPDGQGYVVWSIRRHLLKGD